MFSRENSDYLWTEFFATLNMTSGMIKDETFSVLEQCDMQKASFYKMV